jgi:hypothetical protein
MLLKVSTPLLGAATAEGRERCSPSALEHPWDKAERIQVQKAAPT